MILNREREGGRQKRKEKKDERSEGKNWKQGL